VRSFGDAFCHVYFLIQNPLPGKSQGRALGF
jgi:hypothetical protein